jgi:hypothetical protein
MEEIWVVEFSPDQNCFHIGTLLEHVKSNLAQTLSKKYKDRWLIIFAHHNIDECYRFIEEFERKYEEIHESSIYFDTEIRNMLDG